MYSQLTHSLRMLYNLLVIHTSSNYYPFLSVIYRLPQRMVYGRRDRYNDTKQNRPQAAEQIGEHQDPKDAAWLTQSDSQLSSIFMPFIVFSSVLSIVVFIIHLSLLLKCMDCTAVSCFYREI